MTVLARYESKQGALFTNRMTDTIFHQIQQIQHIFDEKLKTVKAERSPDVFTVFLRDGEGSELEFQPWVEELFEQRTGRSDSRTDHETEFEFRSHPALWEIYIEFQYTADQKGRELLLPYTERYEQKYYSLRVEDNIPIALKPYTRILDFKQFGERLYFDFNHMKADATRQFLETGDASQLKARLEEILVLESTHRNLWKKDYEAKCIRLDGSKPQEIYDDEQEQFQSFQTLISSPDGLHVVNQILHFDSTLPQDMSNREALESWNTEVRAWMDTIQNPRLQALVDFRPSRGIYTRWWPFEMVPI